MQDKTLGRGLSSLLGQNDADKPITNPVEAPYFPKTKQGISNQILSISVDKIKVNPHQPRQEFNERALNELVLSIKEHGVVQPLIVTQTMGGEHELIAGERRLRASKLAGLKEVPVIVRTVKELEKLTKSIFKIHSILRNSYNLKELTINVMGDMITNDRIFQEQVFEIEKCAGLQVWDAINYFSMFFNSLLKIYDKITIVCVVGNHGRSVSNSYNEPVENNFEYFIYKTWEKQFADSKRINVIVPTTRRYVHSICGWKHLIEHGDLIRGASANAIEKQIKDLSLSMGGFDVMHKGHLHKLKEDEIADKVIVKHNGCWIEKDNYGFNLFKSYSVPKQWFFGCNEKRPETWNFKIDLRV